MPPYMLDLWRSGRCPLLVPAAFYEERGTLRVRVLPEGLVSAASYAAACPDGVEGSFCLLLSMLASAALAFRDLQLWLADPEYISLDPRDLFYDREKGQGMLALQAERDGRPFLERFCGLCRGLGAGGSLIAERLEAASSSAVLEERETAAFLSAWQRQILEGRDAD